jgi:ABC-2 type transport system permease protein
LFPAGDVTLLSGTQTSLTGGIGRLAVVVGYASLMMLAMAAIGLFISTLTEVPVAAMAATLVFAIIMQVLDAVPQLRSIHSWLLSDYLLKFDPALRDPFRIGDMATGMWVASAYVAIFWLLAWARFTTKDVSS